MSSGSSQRNLLGFILWIISSLLLLAGMVLPMFSFHKFYIFDDTFSLFGGVIYLLEEGELFLFLILFAFSIALPIYKMVLSFLLVNNSIKEAERKLKIVNRLAIVGKWSMTDVFVIAILAATVKLGMIATIEVHTGLFVFGAGVITSMLLVHRLLAGYELRAV
ncbi:paraquat-inducible protein A [Mariprofundus sp. NF]|nr:paraquat-inducible protein A [Mariprofundus sp. NF]